MAFSPRGTSYYHSICLRLGVTPGLSRNLAYVDRWGTWVFEWCQYLGHTTHWKIAWTLLTRRELPAGYDETLIWARRNQGDFVRAWEVGIWSAGISLRSFEVCGCSRSHVSLAWGEKSWHVRRCESDSIQTTSTPNCHFYPINRFFISYLLCLYVIFNLAVTVLLRLSFRQSLRRCSCHFSMTHSLYPNPIPSHRPSYPTTIALCEIRLVFLFEHITFRASDTERADHQQNGFVERGKRVEALWSIVIKNSTSPLRFLSFRLYNHMYGIYIIKIRVVSSENSLEYCISQEQDRECSFSLVIITS